MASNTFAARTSSARSSKLPRKKRSRNVSILHQRFGSLKVRWISRWPRRSDGTDLNQLGSASVPIAPNARHDFEAKGGSSVGPPYAYMTRVGGNGRNGAQADRGNRANAGSPSREHRASQRACRQDARAS